MCLLPEEGFRPESLYDDDVIAILPRSPEDPSSFFPPPSNARRVDMAIRSGLVPLKRRLVHPVARLFARRQKAGLHHPQATGHCAQELLRATERACEEMGGSRGEGSACGKRSAAETSDDGGGVGGNVTAEEKNVGECGTLFGASSGGDCVG